MIFMKVEIVFDFQVIILLIQELPKINDKHYNPFGRLMDLCIGKKSMDPGLDFEGS